MQQREVLEQTGEKILTNIKTQLYVSMRFFGSALDMLRYEMDLSTTTIGTDAVSIRYNPNFLLRTFVEDPKTLCRTYVHILMHCIFRHMFTAKEKEDPELWDLACDIAAESVIDTMEYPIIQDPVREYRAGICDSLREKAGVLTAERIYQALLSERPDYSEQCRMAAEFRLDDHSFWQRMESGNDTPPQLPEEKAKGAPPHARIRNLTEEEWKKIAGRVKAEVTNVGREAGKNPGSLSWTLDFALRRRTDYREFLRRFTVVREEAGIDMDSFDYAYYTYGMQLYGNMPLIEENEFREAKKVEELVIAIDPSESVSNGLVQKFLNETADLLFSGDSFFHKVELHILQCDDRIRQDTKITDVEQMRRYADGFEVLGGGGTDYRPVFAYVEELERRHVLKNLRGLLYFTDGYGVYPKRATPYDTAFVFRKDGDNDDTRVPGWALKLYV